MEPRLGEFRRVFKDVFEIEGGFEARVQRSIGEEKGAQQGQGDADRTDEQVFPCGFDTALRVVEEDQRRGHEGGAFDRHPHQAEVVRPRDQAHDAQKGQEAGAEHAVRALLSMAEIAHRVERTEEEERADHQQNDFAERVENQPGRADRQDRMHQREHGQREMHGSGHWQQPGTLVVGGDGRSECGHQDREENQGERHGLLLQGNQPARVHR